MTLITALAVIALVVGVITLFGKFAWNVRVTTNKGRFLWLAGAWAFMGLFLTGSLIFVWPLFLLLCVGFAAYALYTFTGSLEHRAILSSTFVLPGTISVSVLSPPWPEGWASFKPIFVYGPALVVLVIVALWFVTKRYFAASAKS